jgi:predicted enzyme related to lactoylglutathione lyase
MGNSHSRKPGRHKPGAVPDATAVEATHADWSKRGLTIAQPPTRMDFGHTFVALDPDGHRLRVFAPAPA